MMTEASGGPLLKRYLEGECEQVWAELTEMGEEVKSPSTIDDAWAVACETMRRTRSNVLAIRDRLTKIGYQFKQPDLVYCPPDEGAPAKIMAFETEWGALPLSLRAFYQIVGSVDFCQADAQLVPYMHRARKTASELQIIGEEDPLVVDSLASLFETAAQSSDSVYFCFAPDEFHKSVYSGGENYHFLLPDARADVPVIGIQGAEMFVEHLRLCFKCGGFRGRIVPCEEDPDVPCKAVPEMQITRELAIGLTPI